MLGEDQAEDRLRELLRDPRWALPKWRDPQQRIRKTVRRQRMRLTGMAAGVAAAVIAVALPVGIGTFSYVPGPAGGPRVPPTVYVAYGNSSAFSESVVIPISTATNKAGKPIHLNGGFVSTPDGKTLYFTTGNTVVPFSTATNKPGKPIRFASGGAAGIVINPDGTTAYVISMFSSGTI